MENRNRNRSRRLARGFETLEDRVVLTGSPTLTGSLAILGVVPGAPVPPSSNGANPQLDKDIQTLLNDLNAVSGKSGVTVAELTALQGDDLAAARAGVTLDGSALIKVQKEVAAAVLAGNPSTAAKDFAALFDGKLPATAVTKAFNDEVQIVKDSRVTPGDLGKVAADSASVQKDLGGKTPPPPPPPPPAPPAGSQLAKDLQTLQNDQVALFARSGVTVAELTALQGDDMAAAKAGVKLDGAALIKVQNEVARAVLMGNPGTAAADFAALFGGKMPKGAIDRAFNDEVQIVKDSKVTPADLARIAADTAAVQKDMAAGGGSGSGTPSGPPAPPPSLGGSFTILGIIPAGPVAPPPPPTGGSGH
jgi:hypothetical protein